MGPPSYMWSIVD